MSKFLKPKLSSNKQQPSSSGAEPFPVLSKSVMSMKFMKRKDELANSLAVEQKTLLHLQGGDWLNETSSGTGVQVVREHLDLYSALPGRRSFGGANKAMERYYTSVMDGTSSTSLPAKEEDDEEILKKYADLVSLPRGPAQGKRPSAPKPKPKAKKQQQEDDGYMKLDHLPKGSMLGSGGKDKHQSKKRKFA